MKIKSLFKILFLISLFLLSDCKKDKEENYLTFDGTTYSISSGILKYGGPAGGGYAYDLYLYSPGLNYNSMNQIFFGSGEIIGLQFGSYTSELQSRTYTYNNSSVSYKQGTYRGSLQNNVNTETNSRTIIDLFTGQVDIAIESTTYSIAINVQTKDGKSLVAYYRGSITRF